MRALAAALCLLLAASGYAATDPALLAKLAARQAALDDYAVDMRISVFDAKDASPELEFPARSARRGAAMLQEFRNFVVLLHPDMRVVVDRADRTIHLNAAQAESPAAASFDPASMLAKAAEGGYAVDTEQGAGRITLRFTSDARPAYLLSFAADDLRLARMEMEAPEGTGGRTVVTYDWHPASVVSANRLATDYYVRRERGAWQPAPAFAGYRIVVSREK